MPLTVLRGIKKFLKIAIDKSFIYYIQYEFFIMTLLSEYFSYYSQTTIIHLY